MSFLIGFIVSYAALSIFKFTRLYSKLRDAEDKCFRYERDICNLKAFIVKARFGEVYREDPNCPPGSFYIVGQPIRDINEQTNSMV